MKLHSPKFEAALKEKVVASIFSDRALMEEFERVKSYKKLRRSWTIQFPICLFLPLVIFLYWEYAKTIDACLFAMNLWLVCCIFFFQSYLSVVPYSSIEWRLFPFYPINRNKIYYWERDRALRLSIVILMHCIIGYTYIAYLWDFTLLQFGLVPVIAIISWIACVFMSLIFSSRIPTPASFPIFASLGILFLMMVVLQIGRVENAYLPYTNNYLPFAELNLVLPTGWLTSLVHTTLLDSYEFRGLLVIPLFVLIATETRRSLTFFKLRLEHYESKAVQSLDIVPGSESLGRRFKTKLVTHLEDNVIQQGIISKEFTQPTPWEFGLDNWAWKWFSARQKIVAEFGFSSPPRLLSRWKWVFGPLLLSMFLGLLSISNNPSLGRCLWGCGLLSAGVFLVRILSSCGVVFSSKYGNECFIPNHAFFPVSYWNMFLCLMKVVAVQVPLLAVYGIMLVCFFVYPFPINVDKIVLIVIQIIASSLSICALYYSFLFDYLYSPNFFIERWTKVAAVLLFCLSGLLATILPFFVFNIPSALYLQIAWPVLTLCCPLLQSAAQSLYYRDNKVDSIRLVDPNALYRARRNGYYGKS